MNISIAVDVVLEVRRGEVVHLRGRVLDRQHPRHARQDLRALRRALRRELHAGQDALAERGELRRDEHVRAQLVDRVLQRDTGLEVGGSAAEHVRRVPDRDDRDHAERRVAAAVVAGRVSQLILPPAPSRIFCCDRSFHTRSGRYRVAYQ
jgi:hypothetical protein